MTAATLRVNELMAKGFGQLLDSIDLTNGANSSALVYDQGIDLNIVSTE